MLFTTKTEYGMRALTALAKKKAKGPMSLAQIAKSEHISQSYLERLFAKLKDDGLVKSAKGVNGGYYLAKKPEKISVFDIVEALEGTLAVFYCVSDDEKRLACASPKCLARKVWNELQKNIIATLRKFTLADLI